MPKKIIVIGGNAAGMSTASQVKRQSKEWDVTVFEKGEFVSYASCGMPYYIGGAVSHFEQLIEMKPEEFIEDRKIDLRLKHEVIAIDPNSKKVTVKSLSNSQIFDQPFDYLMISTGASPNMGDFEISSDKVFTLNNLDDTKLLQNFLIKSKPKSCAVVGGGIIAIEMVEAFADLGLEVHMVHRRDQLANIFEPEISKDILTIMEKKGVILNLNRKITQISDSGAKTSITTNSGNIDVDFVLLAIGVVPNTQICRNAGIALGAKGSIAVNDYLQTNFEFIYSGGDCAESRNILTNEKVFTPLALKANREGMIAGLNISGKKEVCKGVTETLITKIFNTGIAKTGITIERALNLGIDAVKYDLISRTKARYYPNSDKLKSFVIIEKGKGSILGAQLIGPIDSVKRIDVWATAIYNRMNINDLFNLDLAYSPPFAPVWDPVLLAARLGKRHL